MPANMPHKGLAVLDGRLDPKIWGRFPIKNMLLGLDGEMLLHGYGNESIPNGDPRLFANGSGTAAPDVAVGEVVLTTESGDNNYATLASNGKGKLAGNRFVLQCDLKVTSVANSAILLGFASDAKNPIPNDASADPADESFGIFKKEGALDLFFSSKVTGVDAVHTDLDVNIADGANIVVKMVSDGKGNIEVSTDGVLRKKVAYPGVANGYLVLGIKSSAGEVETLNLGSAIAFGVAE